MKYIQALFVFIFILTIHCRPASARTVNMLFWYPGEAGSTEEAAPVIDIFFEKINADISPDKIQGKYFNTVDGGLNYIRGEKPIIAIISYPAWIQNANDMKNASVILSTLPLPGDKDTERYALVGHSSAKNNDLPIISSEPLSTAFVRAYLFPNIPENTKVSQNPQILFNLKKIASGELKSLAILTPTEATTLKKLGAPWTKSLKTMAESKEVPTARVVLFDPAWKGIGKFKKSLVSMNDDEEGREILNELRLKGFK